MTDREQLISSVAPSRAWGAVPVWLLEAGVSDGAVALFALLAAKYAPRPGFTAPAPTLDDLALERGSSERTIRRHRDDLVAVGAIAVERHGPRASTYIVAGIGSDGPLEGSDTGVTDRPLKTGHQSPHSPDNRVRPTTSTENYKKTATGVTQNAPAELRPRVDERTERPRPAMYHPTDEERERVTSTHIADVRRTLALSDRRPE